MHYSDITIAAIATALNNSGISIIRVSGKDAFSIVNEIFRAPGGKTLLEFESHTIHYGYIYDSGSYIDEVMVSVFKAPKSYTMEDTVEINCHGGIVITNKILQIVLEHGAVLAEPGEFTKRAFLNGRIDLSKAEAVMDMIHAKNELSAKASMTHLRGKLSEIIRSVRAEILHDVAYLESAIDDPEHFDLSDFSDSLKDHVASYIETVQKLYDSADNGKFIKEGINTVIVGKPNAGKSSLLNSLAGKERAIVTEIAGTTRDTIEEQILLNGISLNVIDTAGIRSTEDLVEKIGVDKAREYALSGDLIIYVMDASIPLDENDKSIISLIENKKVIVLLNKSDLETKIHAVDLKEEFPTFFENCIFISTSTKDGVGMEKLEDCIKHMFFSGDLSSNDEVYLTNMRQKQAVGDALKSLNLVKQSLDDDMPEDFLTIDLMSAYTSLGFVIGEEVGDDLVQEIFSKFCMGK